MSAPLDTLKKVTARFARHFGCPVREIESDLWELRLTDPLQRRFRATRWVLCFHRDLLGADPEAQLVTAGSPVLQRMREALDAEGLAADAFLQPVVPAPAAVPPEIQPVNGALRAHRREQAWTTLVRFHFRLALWGTERHEEFFPVVLDAATGAPAEAALKRALETSAPGAAGSAPPVDRDRLLERAFQEAERRSAPLVVEREDEQERTAQAEIAEAEAFFRESLREADAARRDQLLEFQATRLAEIRERHAVQAELEPRGAVLFRLPRVRLELVLEDGPYRATLPVEIDQLDGALAVPACRYHPGRALRRVGLCPAHGLHCDACHWTCSTCRKPGCPECPRLDCPDCGGAHCQDCTALCAACGSRRGRTHMAVCGSGCGAVCPSCLVTVAGQPCCRRCAVACDCGHGERTARVVRSTASSRTYCAPCAARDLAPCDLHAGLVETASLVRCVAGGERACPNCRKTLASGGAACLKHAADCPCGRTVLATELTRCGNHGAYCPSCRWTCATCGEARCRACQTGACRHCSGMHCAGCTVRCPGCSQAVGKDHVLRCASGCGLVCPRCALEVDGRKHCAACARVASCGHPALLTEIVTSADSGRTYCRACRGSQLFLCAFSQKWSETAEGVACAGDRRLVRRKVAFTLSDGRAACPGHAGLCGCGKTVLTTDLVPCPVHGVNACPHCLVALPHEGGRRAGRCCAVLCARCGAWESQDAAGQCGFCPAPLCRACVRQAESCPVCRKTACSPQKHLADCTGGHPVCPGCSQPCHVCGRRSCRGHGGPCLDCSRTTCSADRQACRLCGVEVCRTCLDARRRCDLCRNPAPARDPAAAAARLRALGRDVGGFHSVHENRSPGRTVYLFNWLTGRQEFYSVSSRDEILGARRRGFMGRLLDSDTEELR